MNPNRKLNKVRVKKEINSSVDVLWDLLAVIRSLYKQTKQFIYHYYAAKITRPVNLIKPKGEVYLIHLCLDLQTISGPPPITSR